VETPGHFCFNFNLQSTTALVMRQPPEVAKAVLVRIEERLALLGLNEWEASRRAVGHKYAINNMRRAVSSGRSGVTLKVLEALAPVLQTTTAWLIEGDDKIEDFSSSVPEILLDARKRIAEFYDISVHEVYLELTVSPKQRVRSKPTGSKDAY
jgi:hypothetical protein